ncbi:PTS sugar transporter subunit IIA [Fundicoccus culcitae]|uniref:Ascorbate-specific PTS system EIIA component n=1 Tax=Fundicoccus culcitae TaxID=2969821 RepID=A0ABY5P4B7_9LACT|nr:PTS sugar transporter subunit IIA [Fundicoccus culcitae]UUX33529.1 PTS sugar transporter subunit IIA [Fundicoccus culcitae]
MIKIIRELLPKSRMQHKQSVANWMEAVQIASAPLLDEGFIEEEYINAMIESVNTNGPYIVLKDYFALPHAQAGKGVQKKGMSLLTLEQPVDLKGNPIKNFLVLAAIDSNSHLEALSDLSNLLMNDDIYEVFIAGDISKIDTILESMVD